MLQTIDIITQVGISLSLIILLPIGIILGIFFGLKISDSNDQDLKKKNKQRMWWSLTTPFLIIIFLVIITGLIKIIVNI